MPNDDLVSNLSGTTDEFETTQVIEEIELNVIPLSFMAPEMTPVVMPEYRLVIELPDLALVEPEPEMELEEELEPVAEEPSPRVMDIPAPDAPHLMLSENQVRVAWIVHDRMREAGYCSYCIAGFLGNFYRECSFRPTLMSTSGHYGLAQWGGSRQRALKARANYDTIEVQIEFVLEELRTTESVANEKIIATDNVRDAAIAVMNHYERCLWSVREENLRADYAEFLYREMRLADYE
jgi:hypothetical protein